MADRRRRTLGLLIAVALLLGLLPLGLSLWGPAEGEAGPVRVAFLPFGAPDGRPDLGSLAAAVVEGAHTRMARADDPRLSLIGPAVTARFRGSSRAPEALGRSLRADVVLVGGVSPAEGSGGTVAASLLRVVDGRELWTGELTVEAPSDPSARSYVTEWLTDRVRRTLQTARRFSNGG